MADEEQGPEMNADGPAQAEPEAPDFASLNAEQQKEKTFTILKAALDNAAPDYEKERDPDQREHGRQSMDMMERAFIQAARSDEKLASEMYTKKFRVPPSPELLIRASKEAGAAPDPKEMNKLAESITKLGEDRQHHGQKAQQKSLAKEIDDKSVAIGDRESRALDHRRRAHDELMSGLDGKHRDDGLHLLKAFQSGMRSGHEYHNMGRMRTEAGKLKKEHENLHTDHRFITGQIKTFVAGATEDRGGPTTGPMGEAVARNPNVFQRTAAAMARRAPAYEANPAKPGPSMAAKAMAAARSMGSGPSMGG